MKYVLAALVLFLAMPFQAVAQLNDNLKAKMNQEIEYIGSLYSSAYAPKLWKERHRNWNLNVEVALAKTKITAAASVYEAREAVADLLRSTADYHVGFRFYSTERSSLPFSVSTLDGKTLIVYIDRTKLSYSAFPYSVGDEILTFDQVPVAAILEQVRRHVGNNVEATDRALADLSLTSRNRARNYAPPRGPVTLSVKRASNDSVGTVQLAWEYTPEKLRVNFSNALAIAKPVFELPKMVGAFADVETAGNPYSLGNRDSFLPEFGAKIWETASDNTFQAYMYQNEDGKFIGVVRIPSYMPADTGKAVNEFAEIVQRFQKFTAALIIDQNNNPGGSVFYLYSLVSMLNDQASVVPKHRIALLPSNVEQYFNLYSALEDVKSEEEAQKALGGDNLQGIPVTFQLAMSIRDYCLFLMEEYRLGKNLSEPAVFWGVDKINPHSSAVYTKPIIILTNSLDFSGGDFFPAILQDNKRVTIVGTRTAGAGGYVLNLSFPSNLGLQSLSFTGSLAERVDRNPIENLGVTPDVLVPMTVEDIRGNYSKYIQAVKEVVKSKLQ
jgi:hypothetical protein